MEFSNILITWLRLEIGKFSNGIFSLHIPGCCFKNSKLVGVVRDLRKFHTYYRYFYSRTIKSVEAIVLLLNKVTFETSSTNRCTFYKPISTRSCLRFVHVSIG